MFADLVGYTALGQKDESLSLEVLKNARERLRPIISKHNGTEIKTMGDAFLIEFGSALEAVECAIDMQSASNNDDRAAAQNGLPLRIGIHVGDVVHDGGDVYGDAVNVASRIEPLAGPGGTCLTQQVYDHVKNKIRRRITALGMRTLKNVSDPIDVYEIEPNQSGPEDMGAQGVDRRRIVVLPLVNISADSKDEFFADGMTEELIGTLSRIRSLKVVARTSAMRYKGEKKTVGEIGRELNVGTILEGSVRKVDNKVRINIELVDAKSEEQLWSSKYDREILDVFSLQSEIAEKVARTLEVRLGKEESFAIGRRQTSDAGAYTLYLRGRYFWNTRMEEGLNRAIKLFEESIARDPSYALAYVGLGDCYSMLGLYGHRRPNTVYPIARDNIQKALDLDENLAEAHASMGEVLMQFYQDWPRAGEEIRRALDLNPNYATAQLWLSTFNVAQGLIEEALEAGRKAEELDPLSMIILTELGKTLYYAGRNEEAINQYKKSLEIDTGFAIAHKGLAEVYAFTSRFEEALTEIQTAISLSKGSVFILDDLGYIYGLRGMRKEAEKVLDDLERLSTETYVPPFGRAVIYAGLGDNDKAMEWLLKTYEERSFLTWLKVDPAFKNLRNDTRFIQLLKKIGLD